MKKHDHLDGLEQQLHDHIEAEIQYNLARGMSPDQARLAARLKLGNISSIREKLTQSGTGCGSNSLSRTFVSAYERCGAIRASQVQSYSLWLSPLA
jgi:hypothetical protein